MSIAWAQHAVDHTNIWHRRGALGFSGAGGLMMAAAWLTDSLDHRTFITLVVASLVVAATAVVLAVCHQATRQWSLLLWPIATVATLVAFSGPAEEGAGLLTGLIPLAFLHVGLSQPPGRGLWLLLPAAAAWVTVLDVDPPVAAIRLPLSMLIWAATSELPSRLLTEVRGQREVLRVAAMTDSLTRVLNRSTLADRVQSAAVGSSVALIDIDLFKQFNDSHGHVAGDVVLTDFAAMLVAQCRSTDDVFRYGGEEFVVIFDALRPSRAALVIDRFSTAWAGHPSKVSFSAGIAPLAVGGIKLADELLYEAKRSGRGRVVVDHAESA
jgi:diguanylate cyclase (GGDEF)-like protein